MSTKRLKLGLKIYAINSAYVAPATTYLQGGQCDFLEIAVSTTQQDSHVAACAPFAGHTILHAPHSYAGFNPANKNARDINKAIIDQVEKTRLALKATQVIFHPGIEGNLDETIEQFKGFFKTYPALQKSVIMENKPGIGLKGEPCCGTRPEDMNRLKHELGVGFCFDFGHAICAANSYSLNWQGYVEQFLQLKPNHYHISDGWIKGVKDVHLHFGKGDYDMQRIIDYIPSGAAVTIETPHDYPDKLDDFLDDAAFLRKRGA